MLAPVRLRLDGGISVCLDTDRWHRPPSDAESRLLASVAGPALDVGCGPGRLVAGLARLGTVALGVDPAPGAVAAARSAGASVLQRSVFDRLPREGRWRTVLLIDGNIGIGGDPIRLLSRCAALISDEGTIVAELEPPGTGCVQHRARVERGDSLGPWFRWAHVGVDAIEELAAAAGLAVDRVDSAVDEDRWFGYLLPSAARACDVA